MSKPQKGALRPALTLPLRATYHISVAMLGNESLAPVKTGTMLQLILALGLSMYLALSSGSAALLPTGVTAKPVSVPGPSDSQSSLAAAEFSRIVQEFSEEGGYFWSENLISNETSYLHIVPRLRELGASGGAYIGVGPEQNFTYIAKIKPQIAFIVDIRRQAIIQHL